MTERVWECEKDKNAIFSSRELTVFPLLVAAAFAHPKVRVHVRTTGIWSTSLSASGPRCKLFMTAFSVHGWGQHWSTTGCYATRSVPSWSTGSSWSNFASDSASCQCTWEGSRWWFKNLDFWLPGETRMEFLDPGFCLLRPGVCSYLESELVDGRIVLVSSVSLGLCDLFSVTVTLE